jgi:hypothetical protein
MNGGGLNAPAAALAGGAIVLVGEIAVSADEERCVTGAVVFTA